MLVSRTFLFLAAGTSSCRAFTSSLLSKPTTAVYRSRITTLSSIADYSTTSTADEMPKDETLSLYTQSVQKKYKSLGTPAQFKSLISLLTEACTVPYIVRYRVPSIGSRLSTNSDSVHEIARSYEKWLGLESSRNKVFEAVKSNLDDNTSRHILMEEILTSDSKSRLDEIYAPFKPASKGSLAERAVSEYGDSHDIVAVVDNIYKRGDFRNFLSKFSGGKNGSNDVDFEKAVVTLIATELNKEAALFDGLVDEIKRFGFLETKEVKTTTKTYQNNPKKAEADRHRMALQTYLNYTSTVRSLRDHQVLALRRGSDLKIFSLSFSLDDERAKSNLINRMFYGDKHRSIPQILPWRRPQRDTIESRLVNKAVDDVYTRLMKKRATGKVWREHLVKAELAGIRSFGKNYHQMMLYPPLVKPRRVLAVDPGFRGGIKLAALGKKGEVKSLESVDWMKDRERSVEAIGNLLNTLQKKEERVLVALGTGTASSEAEELVKESAIKANVSVDIEPVSEDGASVWSASPVAKEEFPNPPSVAVLGAVSIGRRLQDPMNVLVSIPPKSLGLGMYQHDLNETELYSTLDDTCVECIAEVGVDANTCSVDLMRKVPGLKKKGLAEKIIAARPFTNRQQIAAVKGIGAAAFENCAGFMKIFGGDEKLDETILHPTRDYKIAKFIEKGGLSESEVVERFETSVEEITRIKKALELGSKDVRLLAGPQKIAETATGSVSWNIFRQNTFGNLNDLQTVTPFRGVLGKVKNVVAFGAFVDIGLKTDGLLHISKFNGDASVFAGARIGVDIIDVEPERGRIKLDKAVEGRIDKLPDQIVSEVGGGSMKRKREDNGNVDKKEKEKKKKKAGRR